MKLKLSDEQIALLVKNESERLQKKYNSDKQKLEKKYETDLKELTSKLESDINKLTNKFQYIEVVEPTPLKLNIKIDAEVVKQLVSEKKTVKEIAEYFKTTESSIRSKLWKLNIKHSEKPVQ
jgi:hypothetical protein